MIGNATSPALPACLELKRISGNAGAPGPESGGRLWPGKGLTWAIVSCRHRPGTGIDALPPSACCPLPIEPGRAITWGCRSLGDQNTFFFWQRKSCVPLVAVLRFFSLP